LVSEKEGLMRWGSLVAFVASGVTILSACASGGAGRDAAARAECEDRRFSANVAIDSEAARLGLPRCLGDGRWRFEVSDERVWWLSFQTDDGERRVAGENLSSHMYAFGVDLLSNVRVLELGGSSAPAVAFDLETPDYGRIPLVAVWNGEEAMLLDRAFGVMPRQVDGVWLASGTIGSEVPCAWMRPPEETFTYVLTSEGYTRSHPVARAANLAQCAPSSSSFVVFSNGSFDAARSARALRCAIARGEPAERLQAQLDAVCDEGPGGGASCEPPAPGPRTCPAYWGLSDWIEATKSQDKLD